MKETLRNITPLLVLIGILSLTSIAGAAVGIDPAFRPDYAPQTAGELSNPEGAADNFTTKAVTQIIADFAVVLIQVAGSLSIYFVITNGLHLVKSFGKDEELQKAKKGLTWAIAGLVIVIVSYAIVQNVLRITLTVDSSQL